MSGKFKNDTAYTGFFSAIEVWQREMKHLWPVYLMSEIEADRLNALREQFRASGKIVPTYTALVIKAIAMAIDQIREEHPEINAYIWRFLWFKRIHVFPKISCGCVASIEMDGQDRVSVGVVFDPEKLKLDALTAEMRRLNEPGAQNIQNVRFFYRVPKILQIFFQWIAGVSPKLRYENRGSFNITTVGKFGIDLQTVPQSTSLQFGFGQVRERVVARDGRPLVVPTFFLTCGFDRRIMNGKAASKVMELARKMLNEANFPGEF